MSEAAHGAGPASGPAMRLAEAPAKALSLVACLMLFTMMTITFLDVIGRYFFSSPLPSAYELVSLCMPAIIFCALPLANLREEHVTVDLLDGVTPGLVKRAQGVIVNLVVSGATGFVAWRLWVRSSDQARFSEVTEELFLPLWPFSLVMAVLCAVAALASLAAALAWASGARRRAET